MVSANSARVSASFFGLFLFALSCVLVVYALSLAINKFDTCHQGVATVEGGDHSEEDLQWRKDFLTTVLTIGITVPATLFARYIFSTFAPAKVSALPLFSIAIGIMASIGCFWGTQIIKTQPVEESESCAASRVGKQTKGILWAGFTAGIVMAVIGLGVIGFAYKNNWEPPAYPTLSIAETAPKMSVGSGTVKT